MSVEPPSPRALAARYRVGSRIRAARLHGNLSQEELAERVGLDRKTIYRIELGTIGARLDWLVEIASVVRVNLAELVRDA